ncbi:MAG: ArgE/DapE family deacylase [Bacillota bacterium]
MAVDPEVKARIFQWLDDSGDDLVQSVQELVRIPSVVGDEGRAQRYMAGLLSAAGLRVEEFEADYDQIKSHPAYCGWSEEPGAYRGRPNVIGLWDGDPGARSLILNGHIDIVSPEPLSAWTYDPYEARIVDGRMYGRGANDMKGGLVAAVYALWAIRACGYRPRGTVQIQSVIEEEAGGGGGTLACLIRGYTADAFVAMEPTRNDIRIANSGILYFRVSVLGKTAHAGNAHLGVNAIQKITRITDALFALDESRGRDVHYPLFEVGSFGRSCNLSLGTIRGGDWPSTVCGWATVEGRLSFVPGETMAGIKALVEATIQEVADADPWLSEYRPVVEWFGWRCDPWEEDPEHPFIQLLRRVAHEVTGRKPEITGRASGVDSRFSHLWGFPGVCYGAAGANNHGTDEYTLVDRLVPLAKTLALLALEWCGWEEGC